MISAGTCQLDFMISYATCQLDLMISRTRLCSLSATRSFSTKLPLIKHSSNTFSWLQPNHLAGPTQVVIMLRHKSSSQVFLSAAYPPVKQPNNMEPPPSMYIISELEHGGIMVGFHSFLCYWKVNMVVSINGGTPKWMFYTGRFH